MFIQIIKVDTIFGSEFADKSVCSLFHHSTDLGNDKHCMIAIIDRNYFTCLGKGTNMIDTEK